jgi:hypothetical protein
MLRRTSTTLRVLIACGLALSAFQSNDGQKGSCVACAPDDTDGGDPGVRRPTDRGDHVGCTLNATDGVDDVGEIDQSGSGDDLIDLSIDAFSSDLSWLFGVSITVYWVRESGAPNAYFHPSDFPKLRRYARFGEAAHDADDGTVFLGTKLMRSELKEGHRYALAAIVGHEFGHAMQAKKQCSLSGKWRELHADYMGGYYIGARHHELNNQAPKQAYISLSEKGDYNFNEVGHHGTPEERGSAFEAGYRYALSIAKNNRDRTINRADAARAYDRGLTIVEALKSMEDVVKDRPR